MADATVTRCRPSLGTFVEITVPEAHAGAVDAAFATIAHVHARMSFHEEASDLGRLRRAEAGQVVAVDPDTVAVLRLATRLYAMTDGLFDVTIGRRLVAAGFLPRPTGIDLRAISGTMTDLDIIDDRHVRWRRPMLIDLGGIAKGHAVDRAIEGLREHGVGSALVNAGGDLRVLGDERFPIHLRGADGSIDGVLPLASGALASSSNLHLRRRWGGREASPHFAGAVPVLASSAVTVFAETCAVADAMTKIALVDTSLASTVLGQFGGYIVNRPPPRLAA